MKFSQPLVLLLGSVLSASGVGCSAISAIATDSRPAHRETRSDTDRIAAIGRVFENQGRYDKAEAMYRRALKSRPQDADLRSQLQQLAERRKEKSFGPGGTANAIAVADIVSPPKSNTRAARVVTRTENETPILSAPVATIAATSDQLQTLPDLTSAGRATLVDTSSSITNAGHTPVPVPQIDLTAGNSNGWRKSSGAVTTEQVMAALESPDQHLDLLLDALAHGDSTEAKALAATLLGDCDPGNPKVKEALSEQLKSQAAPDVLLALCDSQIERGEFDSQTLSRLITLSSGSNRDIQIQAMSQLRNFAGTEFEPQCTSVLSGLLRNPAPNVRATAALTLGDFSSLSESMTSSLRDLVSKDPDPNVREAAESTFSRQQPDTLQVIPTQNGSPQ